MATTRELPPSHDLTPDLYRDPWTPDCAPESVNRLVLATWRADQLATHLAARLADVADSLDDVPDSRVAAAQTELHALSLCAVQIRQLLAEVTRLAGAYV